MLETLQPPKLLKLQAYGVAQARGPLQAGRVALFSVLFSRVVRGMTQAKGSPTYGPLASKYRVYALRACGALAFGIRTLFQGLDCFDRPSQGLHSF